MHNSFTDIRDSSKGRLLGVSRSIEVNGKRELKTCALVTFHRSGDHQINKRLWNVGDMYRNGTTENDV
ncbi:hypothetical protein RRG08_027411 [Elysia crispata]|uniref:Uncharacterized protein n=1 Tax=Elysia crispata TaxID=231223 RepID=A0AAE0YF88_9GAST|nr:hypothetical protein RRG08_027411 [Elysia crispata]